MNANPDSKPVDQLDTAFENAETKSAKPTRASRPLRTCLVIFGTVVLLTFTAAYGYQQWFGLKADPSLKDVEIVSGKSDPGDKNDDKELTGITAGITREAIDEAEHPLIPALEVAKLGLKNIEENVHDYQAVVIKQALVRGKLTDLEHMKIKIRHARELEDGTKIPFSVYTRFLSPDAVVGQEAIYVDGWNDGKLIAHLKPGIFNQVKIPLDPNGPIAMKDTIYPITMLGIKNLIKEMLAKGTRDLDHGECEVTFDRNIEIEGRKCMLLEITHPVQRDHFEFHKAKIYIDLELEIPIAYEGFLWPEEEGGEPQLLEKYIYTELKLNIGLKDSDFDPDNEEYDYPG